MNDDITGDNNKRNKGSKKSIPKDNSESRDYLNYLYQGAFIHDTLLQSYRMIVLTLETIYTAFGIILFVRILDSDEVLKIAVFFVVLLILFVFNYVLIVRVKKTLKNRGDDLPFFAVRIMQEEQKLDPKKKYYTLFKAFVLQEDKSISRMLSMEHKRCLDNTEIEQLVNEVKSKEKCLNIQYLFDTYIFIPLMIIWWAIILLSGFRLLASILCFVCPECKSCVYLGIL